jgi:hypothetical protein
MVGAIGQSHVGTGSDGPACGDNPIISAEFHRPFGATAGVRPHNDRSQVNRLNGETVRAEKIWQYARSWRRLATDGPEGLQSATIDSSRIMR